MKQRLKRELLGAVSVWGLACAMVGPTMARAELLASAGRALPAPFAPAVTNDIPVFPRAMEVTPFAPSAAELQQMLRTLGSSGTATVRGLRAIVFRVPGPVSAEDIMQWYATTQT